MIGAPLPPSLSLYSSPTLRPAAPAGGAAPARADAWLDGLALHGGPALKADVAADQRGLTVQQHADRVLAALVG